MLKNSIFEILSGFCYPTVIRTGKDTFIPNEEHHFIIDMIFSL